MDGYHRDVIYHYISKFVLTNYLESIIKEKGFKLSCTRKFQNHQSHITLRRKFFAKCYYHHANTLPHNKKKFEKLRAEFWW